MFPYFAVWNLRNHEGPYSDNSEGDCRGDSGGFAALKQRRRLVVALLDCAMTDCLKMKTDTLPDGLGEIYWRGKQQG